MCGVAGVLRFDGEPVATATLEAMGAAVAHRGPDGEGMWADGPIGLVHRRLAIIDLSPAGHEPMSNETGDILLSYNGELYNFQQLRVELEAHGHHFHSRTDAEVVIHAYEEWGDAFLCRLNGHFAFAIWDGRAKQLLLARDRFGVKPLYYLEDDKRLLFGSEIKAILAHPGVRRSVHHPSLNEYFTFQNVLTDATLFEGIRILPAGCFMKVTSGSRSKVERYWDFRFPDPLQISEEEASEELYRLFTQAVTRQLMSDVPVGAYLSGGMDSGSITAVARRQLGRLMTFTMGFDLSSASGLELGFDERTRSEFLSNLLKTEHYEMVLHAGDMENVMPELIWHLEDLRIGQSYPNFYVARMAGRFVKVVLSGAGGDELFGGYPWRYYRGLSGKGRDGYFRNYYNFWQRLVTDEDKVDLFRPESLKQLEGHSTFEVFRQVFGSADLPLATNADLVNASLYFELKTFLHGLLLVEDKVSMAHGLETRAPFLDNELVDFALSLSPSLKLANLEQNAAKVDEDEVGRRLRYESETHDGKLVLRRAMAKLIPAEVTSRTKQGFSAPDASWFRGESIDYVKGLLGDPSARIFEYLEPAFVSARLDEHTQGRVNHRLLIWSLLSFEWWLRKFMVS